VSEREERIEERLERLEEQMDEALDLLHTIADVVTQPVQVAQLKSQVMIFGAAQANFVQ
jgi:hypothetical protein